MMHIKYLLINVGGTVKTNSVPVNAILDPATGQAIQDPADNQIITQ